MLWLIPDNANRLYGSKNSMTILLVTHGLPNEPRCCVFSHVANANEISHVYTLFGMYATPQYPLLAACNHCKPEIHRLLCLIWDIQLGSMPKTPCFLQAHVICMIRNHNYWAVWLPHKPCFCDSWAYPHKRHMWVVPLPFHHTQMGDKTCNYWKRTTPFWPTSLCIFCICMVLSWWRWCKVELTVVRLFQTFFVPKRSM